MVSRPIRSRSERMLGCQRALEARDPATPPARLRKLAADDVRPVRVLVARNFDTPRDALEQLTRDEDDYVRTSAIAPPARELSGFLHGVVHHPGVPTSLRTEVLAAGPVPRRVPSATSRHPRVTHLVLTPGVQPRRG